MKQFGLRYLYKHLGQALKEIPFEITNHNRVIAVVTKPEVIRGGGGGESFLTGTFSNGGDFPIPNGK